MDRTTKWYARVQQGQGFAARSEKKRIRPDFQDDEFPQSIDISDTSNRDHDTEKKDDAHARSA